MLKEILEKAKDYGASDIHLVHNTPITYRINGKLQPSKEVLTTSMIDEIVRNTLSTKQQQQLQAKRDIDISYELPGIRSRINIYYQGGIPALAVRMISTILPDLRSLNLPSVIENFATYHSGLILITGQTGSGKSTTLAGIIKRINETRSAHIITLENPIEYKHKNIKSLVNQREIYSDAIDFPTALRSALRQDPDVILIGEMRDAETISTALTAAETGHLVLSTLHTSSASQAIDRIIDAFPSSQHHQIKVQLATSLKAIVTQQLLTTIPGKCPQSLMVACEVLINTPATQNLIREGKSYQLNTVIQTSQSVGMKSMAMSLADLVNAGIVSYTTAAQRVRPEDLKNYIRS